MHLGITCLLLILGRTRRPDDGGIHDRAALELHAARLKHPADFGKQLLAQFVGFEKTTKLQQCGGVRDGFTAQFDPRKATQASAIVKRLFAGEIGEVEPVLDEMDTHHALQTNRRTAIAALRVMRLDHRAQLGPGIIVFIVSRNSSRRVRLRWVSKPAP